MADRPLATDGETQALLPLLGLIAGGLLFWGLVPRPEGIEAADWPLGVLFLFLIVGIIWHPYPIATLVLVALALGSCLQVFTIGDALGGFSNSVTWIIVAAFLFARAFIKTGFGRRVALVFIHRLGSSSLKLGYALALTDLVLAPVTASNTARAGGIVYPVVRSLASEFDSEPGATARKIGAYLLFTAYQANVVTSATFLTAMAANGVSIQLAYETAGVEITWGLWLYASFLPAAISMLLTPWLIYRTYRPELTETKHAQQFAGEQLQELGPMTRDERVLVWVFSALAVVWATSSFHPINPVAAALAAIAVLLLSGVLTLIEISGERSAWGTFIWFGGIISIAGTLTRSGLTGWFVEVMKEYFSGMDGLLALVALVVLYVYVHYAFASMTSQIIALYAAFLGIALAAGAPALLAALVFCFFSNLYATLTHYGDGAAPIFFGSGYIEQSDWWRVGFYLSVAHIVVWIGVGLPWWKLLGIW